MTEEGIVLSSRAGLQELAKRYSWPSSRPPVEPVTHGWFHPQHEHVFFTLLSEKTKVIVEAGSWLGKSSTYFVNTAKNATLICIDTWQGSREHFADARYSSVLPVLYELFLVNLWKHRERNIPIRQRSIIGLVTVYKYGIKPDIVYIDASHEYEDVSGDLAVTSALFPDAVIVGDDFAPNFPGVQRAVREFEADNRGAWNLELEQFVYVLHPNRRKA